MAEMTIETLIKIIIGVVVLVAVILGVYFSMTHYIIPYFNGFGFNYTDSGSESAAKDVCERNGVWGTIGAASSTNKNRKQIFKDGQATDYFVDGTSIQRTYDDGQTKYFRVGIIQNGKITGLSTGTKSYAELNGKIILGDKICNPNP